MLGCESPDQLHMGCRRQRNPSLAPAYLGPLVQQRIPHPSRRLRRQAGAEQAQEPVCMSGRSRRASIQAGVGSQHCPQLQPCTLAAGRARTRQQEPPQQRHPHLLQMQQQGHRQQANRQCSTPPHPLPVARMDMSQARASMWAARRGSLCCTSSRRHRISTWVPLRSRAYMSRYRIPAAQSSRGVRAINMGSSGHLGAHNMSRCRMPTGSNMESFRCGGKMHERSKARTPENLACSCNLAVQLRVTTSCCPLASQQASNALAHPPAHPPSSWSSMRQASTQKAFSSSCPSTSSSMAAR